MSLLLETPVLIIFQNGHPFSIITDKFNNYDVEYCRRDECCYWSLSGQGGYNPKMLHEDGAGETWLAEGYGVFSEQDKNPIIKERPEQYKTHPSEWENFEEAETVYCTICNDFLPEEWGEDEICEHVKWDDEGGWWGGEGYDG